MRHHPTCSRHRGSTVRRMPLDVVPDDRRVLAGVDLYLSRFGRAPSVVELVNLTGMTEARVTAALVALTERTIRRARDKAVAPLERPRAIPRKPPTERLICGRCGHIWERAATRGRKPGKCPPCRLSRS